jgi:pyruvate dehydrogenase E1 component beta subunit/2-oxoisovalerate dehydrogenase E1 component
MGTALDRHVSDSDIANNPPAYGVPSESVNGMDVVAVERAVHNAAESVRETSQPRFLELRTYRFRAHSMYDAQLYRSKAEVQQHQKDDPIEDFQERAMSDGLMTQADIDTIEEEAAKEIAEAVEFAEQGEWEPVENIARHTYARDLS